MPQTPAGAFDPFNSSATSLNSKDLKNKFLHKLWIMFSLNNNKSIK